MRVPLRRFAARGYFPFGFGRPEGPNSSLREHRCTALPCRIVRLANWLSKRSLAVIVRSASIAAMRRNAFGISGPRAEKVNFISRRSANMPHLDICTYIVQYN
jgi:predicted metal-dependent enzyme (double-stranded beta helix superfamily)